MGHKHLEIRYVQDALCGWCYGFSPVIERLNKHYKGRVSIKPVHGGLWTGDKVKSMDDSLVAHLRKGVPQVTQATGQVFGEQFYKNVIQNPEFIYDTEPAARAGIVVRTCSPEHELNYLKAIQIAFFVHGFDPTKLDTFLPIVRKYGITQNQFIDLYHSKQTVIDTHLDFAKVRDWGVHAFPSLLCQVSGRTQVMSTGLSTFNHVVKLIDGLLAKEKDSVC